MYHVDGDDRRECFHEEKQAPFDQITQDQKNEKRTKELFCALRCLFNFEVLLYLSIPRVDPANAGILR